MLLIDINNSQYVYTQIGKDLTFTKTTQQVRQGIELGNEFRYSKQYSIWGWFRYKDGDQPSIMNILNLHNDKEISNNSAIIGPFPNPEFPDCPYSSEQIKKLPNIVNQPEVKDNPNCFPKKIDNTDVYRGRINAKKQDILYINFDLVPTTVGPASFNITFLFQNGDQQGFNDMKITGFNDIPLLGEYWGFFAISFDYQRGQSTMYFKIFDNSFNNSQIKTFQLNYQNFLLQKNSTLTIASVENNNYFEQVAGFTGNIAYIEMSAFYTTQLNTLWTGYMNATSFPYKGIIVDLYFDIAKKNDSTLVSKGLLNEEYTIQGNYESLYEIDINKTGVRFKDNSFLNFGAIDTSNQDQLQAIVFYFKLSFHEDLPSDFTIVQRGIKSSNGYIRISLIKVSQGRSVKVEIQGDQNLQENKWTSSQIFPEDQQIIFQVGIALSPQKAGRLIYADQYKNSINELLNDNLNFDLSPQQITLFDDNNFSNYKGYIDFKNFKILNSGSSIEFFNQTQKAVEKSKFELNDDCLFRSSYYKNANICFDCITKVLSQNNFCVPYCDKIFKNAQIGQCQQCKDQNNCDDIEKTTWKVEVIEPSVYRLRPTRKLLGGFNQIEDNLQIKFNKEESKNNLYDYVIKDTYVNEKEQYVDLDIQFRDTIVDEKLLFKINEDESSTQYDINRNQIFHRDNFIVKGVDVNTVKEGLCYVHTNKRRALKALAITALTIFFLSVFVLLAFTICCSSRILHLGALWKFLLHNWMKIQLIAFLLFIAIYMPCCIKEFLRWIYLIAVSWNHALRKPINDINEDVDSFQRGMLEARPPRIFYNERIEVFYLHNFGIFFIIQCFFFLLYLVLKIWDLLATQSANIFYKLFVFMEFSGLIALFLMTAMQTFVFSALNWRFAVFYHSYFVMCFLITIAYIAVFCIFWIYSLTKLISAEYAFMNPIVKDRYYYFFSGYKNLKWSRTWDHWMVISHFIIGMMIGLLVYHQLSQMIIITSVLIILLCITLILRPWIFTIFTIVEIIQQILILAAVILFLMIAIYDKSDCLTCGKRESVTCWFIVFLFFLAIIIGALGLILQTIMSAVRDEEEDEQFRSTAQYSKAYMQDNYIQQEEQGINNVQNIYNEEVNITTNKQQFEEDVNQNNMQNFMNKIQVDDDESYITNNQSYSYVDIPMQGRAPHELAPDSEDEKYNIDGVVRALNADDSIDSDDLEDSRLELDQQKSHLKVNEQRFYDSVYKPSYENSFVHEKHDQQKLNNLISNRNIQEETVIRNKKISRQSFNSDINTY